MIDSIEIGCTPYDESCAQTCENNYSEKAKIECSVFRNQLYRFIESECKYTYDNMPDSFSLRVHGQAHDFGTYYEVQARFNDENEAAIELAYWLEDHCPAHWDSIAKAELEEQFSKLLHE